MTVIFCACKKWRLFSTPHFFNLKWPRQATVEYSPQNHEHAPWKTGAASTVVLSFSRRTSRLLWYEFNVFPDTLWLKNIWWNTKASAWRSTKISRTTLKPSRGSSQRIISLSLPYCRFLESRTRLPTTASHPSRTNGELRIAMC